MNKKIIFGIFLCFIGIDCKSETGSSLAMPDSAQANSPPQLQILSRALPQSTISNEVAGPIQQLNFQLYKIQVISDRRQIHTVYRERQEIDLIALKTDNLLELFKSNLPSGRYCEVRLFFSRNGSVVIDGKSYPVSMKDKPEMRHPWEWGKERRIKYYSRPDKPSDNPCFLPQISHEAQKVKGFRNQDLDQFDLFSSADADDFDLESSYGQPYWRWGRHWLQSHTLYHLRRSLTVIRMKSAFELTAGRLYSVTINFDPAQSVYKQFGRFYLDPDIELTTSTLVNGPFSVSGLIQDENVVTELSADGSMRMLTTLHPNVELQGLYFFNQATRMLNLQFANLSCPTCSGAEVLPANIFYNLPNSNVRVTAWDSTQISGTVEYGPSTQVVTFTKANTYTLDTSTGYTILNVVATYPTGFDGKFGVLALMPISVAGRSFVDVQRIQNQQTTFSFKIPYKELPGGVPGGNKDFRLILKVPSALGGMKINAVVNGAVCGEVQVSGTNFDLNIPVADKVLTTNIVFDPN